VGYACDMVRLASSTLLTALALAGCSSETPPREPVDHVLVILVDTLRADALGAYGAPPGSTPALDALADESAVFLEAYSQGSWTVPSMISLFTGRRVTDEGGLHLPAEGPVLAERFQRAGFATAAFICNDLVCEEAGFARGFDAMLQLTPYSPNGPILEWLAAHADGKSFAYVHLNEAHDPYVPADPAWVVRRKDPPPLAPERLAYYERVEAELGLQDFDGAVAHIAEEVAGYADDVAYSDARIGELLDAARRLWPAERTVVVVTADHGEGLWTREAMMTGQRGNAARRGEPPTLVTSLMPTHGNQVYRELSHVPLLVRAPGIAPTRINGPVESIDLFPTLLELADLPRPEGLAGASLVARMEGEPGAGEDAFTFTRFNASLITADGWQLILPTDEGVCVEGLELELFDLNVDPEARTNVAARHPDQVERLRAVALRRLRSGLRPEVRDPDPEEVAKLSGLGYLDSEIVEVAREAVKSKPTADLVATVVESTACLARLDAAKALRGRGLTSEQRATLRERLGVEGSAAVRDALETVLGG